MLTSYKKISVIYGGNGRKYASQIKDKLQDLHEKEFYPIKIEDLNTDWVGHDVLGTVVKTIRNSDLIYIVFTLDDIGASKRAYEQNGDDALVGRLRQNVLIELGMALVVCDNTEKSKSSPTSTRTNWERIFPAIYATLCLYVNFQTAISTRFWITFAVLYATISTSHLRKICFTTNTALWTLKTFSTSSKN